MLFSTVLSELVYIRPTVFISHTAMRVVCILFCSFCDHDMVTCSRGPGKFLVLVSNKKSWSWSWKNMEVLVLRPRVLIDKKVLFTSLLDFISVSLTGVTVLQLWHLIQA